MDLTGPLSHTVATAASIVAGAAAIALAWRGRASWEPSEQDLPSGPRRVGGLVAAVAIVLLWSQSASPAARDQLSTIAILAVALAVLALLAYGFLIATQTFNLVIAHPGNKTSTIAIVGGFALTRAAREAQRAHGQTTQELLEGAAYDPDKIWDRSSRALAKMLFVVCYLILTVAGTTALAAVAIVADLTAGN